MHHRDVIEELQGPLLAVQKALLSRPGVYADACGSAVTQALCPEIEFALLTADLCRDLSKIPLHALPRNEAQGDERLGIALLDLTHMSPYGRLCRRAVLAELLNDPFPYPPARMALLTVDLLVAFDDAIDEGHDLGGRLWRRAIDRLRLWQTSVGVGHHAIHCPPRNPEMLRNLSLGPVFPFVEMNDIILNHSSFPPYALFRNSSIQGIG
jgi:hypothetical protein